MADYWLNKLFFDLQKPGMAARFREKREAVLVDYPLSDEMRRAVLADDVRALAPNANAFLLRFYLTIAGLDDAEAMRRLHELKPDLQKEAAHG